jgi:hypothetical protein
LFVAAILGDPRTLAMVTCQSPWEIDQYGEQLSLLRVLLLGWLGGTAQDMDHPPEWPPGEQEDIDAFLATRPALYDAVHPFLGDSEQQVHDAALFAILPLLADPVLAHHIPALTDAGHELAARDTPYRWYAIDRLAAWGQDTPRYPEPPAAGPNPFAGVDTQDVLHGDHDPSAGHLEPWPDSVHDSLQ